MLSMSPIGRSLQGLAEEQPDDADNSNGDDHGPTDLELRRLFFLLLIHFI